ncbi:unnamed protein product [Prorocentrum cordatum]|uniref:Uncharacterized protein n=1 Tax=Prorocentrum cordatum TaxID=2364126 RepID=A0ABN9Q6F1_9DINO|nr:unnamed protein product [Polarella glacialis]
MPPKTPLDQLPSACEELKRELLKDGGSITGEVIAGVERSLRSRAFSSLNTVLKSSHSEKYVEYGKLGGDEERREWLAAFIVGPKSGGSIMRNETSRSSSFIEKGEHAWMTIEEYGGPMGINSPAHDAWEKRRTESATLTTQAEVPEDSVEDIKSMMENHGSVVVPQVQPPSKKRRKGNEAGSGSAAGSAGGGAPEKTLTEDEKKTLEDEKTLAEAESNFKDAIKRAKVQYDKVQRELGEVNVIEDRMAAKTSWGEGPLNYLRSQTQVQKDNNDVLFKVWADMKKIDKLDEVKSYADQTKTITDKMKEVDDAYKTYRKDVLADFAKLKKSQ